MFEERESELYENEWLFDRHYALYTLEDLLGSLPLGEANLKFQPGVIKVYKEAGMMLAREEKDWREYVLKHLQGDWGDALPADKSENEDALASGTGRIYSVHCLNGDEEVLDVITHLDGGFTQLVSHSWLL